jgi:hypothetical protein
VLQRQGEATSTEKLRSLRVDHGGVQRLGQPFRDVVADDATGSMCIALRDIDELLHQLVTSRGELLQPDTIAGTMRLAYLLAELGQLRDLVGAIRTRRLASQAAIVGFRSPFTVALPTGLRRP